jgi:hypothetical protein
VLHPVATADADATKVTLHQFIGRVSFSIGRVFGRTLLWFPDIS